MGAATKLGGDVSDNVIGARAEQGSLPRRVISGRKQLVGAYIALVIFMAIYYDRPEDWVPGLSNVPLAKIAGILALLALVFSLRSIRNRFPREVLYLFLLIGQLFLASILSPVWRGGAVMTTIDFAKILLIVVVIVAAVNTERRLRQLIFVQAASVGLIGAVTVVKGRFFGGRLNGIGGNFSNSNDLALTMVLSLPLCLALLFTSKNRLWKAAWALAMLAMTYVVFLTGSRAGFIALIITAAVCLWHFAIRGRRRYILALVPLVGVIFWLSSGDMLTKRLNETFDSKDTNTEAYDSSQERQLLFWRSIDITKAHPLFGVGPGNFEQLSGVWHESHNTFTQLSSEGGLPALILYLLILWHGFLNLRQTKRLTSKRTESRILAGALHASLIGYIVGSVFGSVGFQFFPYILVAYTTALFSITRNTASQSKKSILASESTISNGEYAHTMESDLSWNPS